MRGGLFLIKSGIALVVFSKGFSENVFLHTVADSFTFRFTQSIRISYCGFARKIHGHD